MPKPKLAITIRSMDTTTVKYYEFNHYFEIIFTNKTGRRLSENELIDAIKDADAVIAGTEPYNHNVLNSSGKLKVISRVGVGTDNIDMEIAQKREIKILNTPNSPTRAVAEHAIALIFTIYKNIIRYNGDNPAGKKEIVSGRLLSGKNAGIIGLGRIGFTVAELLSALGCRIVYFDPYKSAGDAPGEWRQCSQIEELLRQSDIISLHMPAKIDNTPILGPKEISEIKTGSIIINTARSSLIDEKSLLEAIDKGIVSGAGLDVYETLIEDQIQNYPQIILTPHIASNTKESRHDMESEAIDNLIKAFMEK